MLKGYILNMVGSKQLSSKLKTTPKISLRTRQATAPTKTTAATEENNEDLVETIRKIVREELNNWDNQKPRVFSGRTSWRLSKVKNDIKNVQTDLAEIEDDLLDPTFVVENLTELENRSRRNNVRIDDMPERPNETMKNCKEEVRKIIRNKLDVTDDIEIDRCPRMGKFHRNKSKPQTVVSKLLRSKDKHKVLINGKKLKETGIFIYEDFSKATMELRKSLWEEV